MLGKDALGDGLLNQQERRRPGRVKIRCLRSEVKTSEEGVHALAV